MKGSNSWIQRYGEDVLLHLAFLCWFFAAAYFYQERLYSDSGYYLSKVVHYESFWVEVGRYILVFSQWLPLLCVKLGLPMQVVALAYSVGHVLFYYGIYLFCRYYWKQGYVGWWLVMVQCVGIAHGFCTPIFELYYDTGFLVLWWLLLQRKERSWQVLLGMGCLSFFTTINYVLVLIFFGAVVVLYITQLKKQPWAKYAATALGGIIGFFLKQSLLAYPYETEKMDWFWHQFYHKTFPWDGYIRPLLVFYYTYYKELFFIVFLTLGYYLRQKNYLTAFTYLLLLVATQYVVTLTYPDIKHSRYQEQCFFPLIIWGCFPLLLDILPQLKNKARYSLQIGLLIMISYRFTALGEGIEPFRLRVEYLHRMIEKGREQGVYKLVMEEESLNSNVNDPSFTFGMESLLLSALTPQKRAVQLICDSEWKYGQNAQTLQDSTLYLSTYRSFYNRPDSFYHQEAANPTYYNFPPSSYQRLRGRYPAVKNIDDLKDNFKLFPRLEEKYTTAQQVNVPIQIENTSDQAWSSVGLMLSYHWWQADTVVQWEGQRSAVEVDFLPKGQHRQYLVVDCPTLAGDYRLQIDFIGAGEIGWSDYQEWHDLKIEAAIFKKR